MQNKEQAWENQEIISIIKNGGIVVMPTDTIYGMVTNAFNSNSVERIYEIRNRAPDKPCIVLIGDIKELENFSVKISEEQKNKLKEYWSFDLTEDLRPTSIIFDCADDRFAYLHRGTNTLAFRLPAQEGLRKLLKQTGPLIAPSANTEKFPVSESIQEAKNYFGGSVDLYVDGGVVVSKASRVIRLHKDGGVSILRV